MICECLSECVSKRNSKSGEFLLLNKPNFGPPFVFEKLIFFKDKF